MTKDQERGAKVQPKHEEQPLQIVVRRLQPLALHLHVGHGLFLVAEVTGGWRVHELTQISVARHSSVQHAPQQVPDGKREDSLTKRPPLGTTFSVSPLLTRNVPTHQHVPVYTECPGPLLTSMSLFTGRLPMSTATGTFYTFSNDEILYRDLINNKNEGF